MSTRERLRLAILKRVPGLYTPPAQPLGGVHPTRVLVIRPDHLGDVLLSFPALRLLRAAMPGAHITALVGPWCREALAASPDVDEVESIPFPGFTRRPKGGPWAPYLLLRREARRLRLKSFDVAINLRPDFWWGAMLSYLAGVPRRIGYAVPECLPFLSQALPPRHDQHHVRQSLGLVRALVGEAVSCPTHLAFPTGSRDDSFAQEQARRWPGEGPLVFVHPGAGAPVKLWTPSGFAQVADALVERYGARVVVTGGPAEEALVRAVAHASSRPPYILMGVTLGQMAALLRLSDLAVGVDSGILHLAVAMGTPTVHLYGPVDKAIFGPWGPAEKHLVVISDPARIPCNRLDYGPRELARHPCVRDISPSKVLQAIERLLGPPIAARPGYRRKALV